MTRFAAALVGALCGLWLATAHVAAAPPRSVDRLVWHVHVNVADQIDEERLRLVLADATRALEGQSGLGEDYACCSALDAVELREFGTPEDGLDVIDSDADYAALPPDIKIFVADLTWCGGPSPSALGCADLAEPNGQLVVALDARPGVIAKVLAHERGHNAGLQHRSVPDCNVMHPAVGEENVCINAAECLAWQSLGTEEGSCPCHFDTAPGVPLPDDTPCSDGPLFGVCIEGGVCTELPGNDACADAEAVGDGEIAASSRGATRDGPEFCDVGSPTGPDVWYAYTPPCTGTLFADLCGAGFDTVLAVHDSVCPASFLDEIACNDDCAEIAGCGLTGGFESCLTTPVQAGVEVLLRVAGFDEATGDFPLRLRCEPDTPDRDQDGVADPDDNCPDEPNGGQADSDADGIGDACECGDASGDGAVNSIDARLIQRCAVGIFPCPVLCDVTGEGDCNSIDARIVQRFSVGVFGKPDLRCAQRP